MWSAARIKPIIVIISLVLLVFFVWLWVDFYCSQNSDAISIPAAELPKEMKKNLVYGNDTIETANNVGSSDKNSSGIIISAEPPLTEADAYQLKNWQEERGYFDKNMLEEYQHYSEDALVELANQGDIRALQQMAGLYASQGEFLGAKATYIVAAVRGSTYALIRAGEVLSLDITPDAIANDESTRDKAMDILAYYRLADLRGDHNGNHRMHVFLEVNEMTLSAAEQQAVKDRASRLYEEMSESRRNIGLPPFDNTIPSSIEDLL